MKLIACLLLIAVGIAAGLTVHKPLATAVVGGQASQSTVSVADAITTQKTSQSLIDIDVVDGGHCFSQDFVDDSRVAVRIPVALIEWIASSDGINGREPSSIDRPPNLL
ncbi:hypothetical protein NDN16_18660 [Aureimonas altamirensis]|uniref:hypothetical protein n=1 Tax=Aureimonas altamirensis TaxID=370622 RepID=UPI002036D3A3|nr:hypothetical protein [Aureimonas altamirensis]MCM2505688.1 hypothetical protein [Aureimonas altamirensis]